MSEGVVSRRRVPSGLPARYLPVEPLLRRFGGDTGALACAARVSRRQVQRWVETGLRFDKADKVCIAAGETPCVVWPEFHDFDDDLVDDDVDLVPV
jgi:hypothetical protein